MLLTLLTAVFALAPSQTELTIYNGGFGLVKEVRQLSLTSGTQSLAIEDVAAMIDPTSVGFKSLTNKDAFRILEQNYRYDLISSAAILNKSVGQKVRFIRTIGNKRDVLTGTLLSAPTAIVANTEGGSQETYNGMVIRSDDNRIILDPTGEVEVMTMPPNLIRKPTLEWEVNAAKAGDQSVELSYITQGLGWSADYVLTLDSQSKADMQGWVTLNNSSGATWKDAKLKLLAGDVNQVHQPLNTVFNGAIMLDAAAKKDFKEESLFEYHLYTLQRPATVRNNETKQISLLEGHGIPIHKKLILDSSVGYPYYPSEGEVGVGDLKPQVRLEFTNDVQSGLGMPMPKGKIRVYQRDQSGSVQLLGEDQIDHTPRNEKLSLVIGRSFDVVASRKRLEFTRLSQRSTRERFQVEIRNRKETPETVYVLERHYQDWHITDANQDFTKLDSNTAQFVVTLKPNEVKHVTYTVTTKW